MTRTRRIALTFVGAFVLGSLANVVIEVGQPPGARMVAISPAGDLATLAAVTQRTVRNSYLFTATLHDVARGGVLVVADPKVIARDEIENIALMEISVEEFDPKIPARLAVDLAALADVEGEGALRREGENTTFAIVTDGDVEPGTRLRLLFFEQAAFVVDEGLLAGLTS